MFRAQLLKATIALLITVSWIGCGSKPSKDLDVTDSTQATQETNHKDSKKSSPAVSEASNEPNQQRVECSVEGDQRWIEVRQQGEGCETIYHKFGKEDVVATAFKGMDHCNSILDRIQTNLTQAGFNCK